MTITEITRTAIADEILARGVNWAGRFDEPDFLSRIYPVHEMPSTDSRFETAARDIYQHRVLNPDDWEDDWVFYDRRFGLRDGPDETFLTFLCEMLHPAVRRDREEVVALTDAFNEHLQHDGYRLVPVSEISGRPVYSAMSSPATPPALLEIQASDLLGDHDHLARQITRMVSSVDDDPDLAIGAAKELIEATCKAILARSDEPVDGRPDVPKLMRRAAEHLRLTPAGVPVDAPAADTIRRLLGQLAAVVSSVAELRNEYGVGHGKAPGYRGLEPRHARLAAGAASTLAMFLFETFEARSSQP